MSTPSIRLASPADRSVVVTFHRALYLGYQQQVTSDVLRRLGGYRDFESVLREDAHALLQRPEAVVLLAFQDEVPAGYISGRLDLEPQRLLPRRGIIEDWFVDDSFRGKGIGKALFEGLAAHLHKQGADLIEVTTWPDNSATRALFKKLGFTEVEVRYRRTTVLNKELRFAPRRSRSPG